MPLPLNRLVYNHPFFHPVIVLLGFIELFLGCLSSHSQINTTLDTC